MLATSPWNSLLNTPQRFFLRALSTFLPVSSQDWGPDAHGAAGIRPGNLECVGNSVNAWVQSFSYDPKIPQDWKPISSTSSNGRGESIRWKCSRGFQYQRRRWAIWCPQPCASSKMRKICCCDSCHVYIYIYIGIAIGIQMHLWKSPESMTLDFG